MTTTAAQTTTRSTTVEAVLVALREGGRLSAAEVATAAGIGRSTATKTLATLAADGTVQRTVGGRDGARRLPDLWSTPTAPTPAPAVASKGTTTASVAAKALTTAEGKKPAGTPSGAAESDGAARLGRGELTGQVLEFLQAHPGEHSPGRVAAQLGGRSAGAVSNALARLVDREQATLTQDKPRRYAAV